MRKTILHHMLVVLAAGLFLFCILTALIVNLRISRRTQDDLAVVASAMAMAYDRSADAQKQADELAAAGGVRVTVISEDGTVLADSEADAAQMENHAQREEILRAAAEGVGTAVRSSGTLGEQQAYAAVRLDGGGYLRVGVAYGGVFTDALSLMPAFLVALAASLFVATVAANRFARSIAAPIQELSKGFAEVRAGGAFLETADYPYDELRVMAESANEMAGELRRNVTRVSREKARIDTILENMDEGFVLLDDAQNILLINGAACRIFGCNADTVRRKNLVYATRNVALLDAVGEVQKNGGRQHPTVPMPNGRIGRATVSTVRPSEEDEGGMLILIADVTEQRMAVKSRQRFFEAASHELKTPITSISGFSELLCSGLDLPEEQRRDIAECIRKESARMTSLIGDIIMISRLESGDITFPAETLDLGDIVRECCDAVGALAEQNGVTLTSEIGSFVMSASRSEMSQLAGNLIQNAVRYNHEGGRVEVTLRVEHGEADLVVFNTGEPIPEKYRERVFERFFRIDKGRSKAVGGTGLGLAIVKHVAAGVGATVRLDVSADGNTFSVHFPRQQ